MLTLILKGKRIDITNKGQIFVDGKDFGSPSDGGIPHEQESGACPLFENVGVWWEGECDNSYNPLNEYGTDKGPTIVISENAFTPPYSWE